MFKTSNFSDFIDFALFSTGLLIWNSFFCVEEGSNHIEVLLLCLTLKLSFKRLRQRLLAVLLTQLNFLAFLLIRIMVKLLLFRFRLLVRTVFFVIFLRRSTVVAAKRILFFFVLLVRFFISSTFAKDAVFIKAIFPCKILVSRILWTMGLLFSVVLSYFAITLLLILNIFVDIAY